MLKKKGVPKDFTMNRGMVINREVYVPIKEVVKMLNSHGGYRGASIAKLLANYKLGKMGIKPKKSLFTRWFK